MLSEPRSVTQLLQLIYTTQENEAVLKLWTRYRNGVLRQIGQRTSNLPMRLTDQQDLEQDLFVNVMMELRNRELPDIKNREDLWLHIMRSAGRHCQHANRLEEKDFNEMVLLEIENDQLLQEQLAAAEELGETAELIELGRSMPHAVNSMLEKLPQTLRETAVKLLKGQTEEEVAKTLGLANKGIVTRRLNKILEIWREQ